MSSMAASNDLTALLQKRTEIEAELDNCSAVLDKHHLSMSDPLIDSQGFPRSDIDVAACRIARTSIIRLRNDHKAVMSAIEASVHAGFQVETASQAAPPHAPQPASARTVFTDRQPFALVNSVADASPAALAGLQAGDQIVTFGSTHAQNHRALARLAEEVAHATQENTSIEVTVLRKQEGRTAFLRRAVRPNTAWGGRGALGAHFLPL
ncbi:hypothetical protein BCR37DRAFT_170985 [Protomyces lactucae-debilis]|uniref:Probable 26S proteasome regulatory subunit p27 n=1 Tax=Protomyces lactucae-debilis TaxID=2754530 RepID=A0A1Y2EX96_PROLT|nr:uncharacterized protein BCR37DRAFT_170985 [Protomyces lactucae-debilis]ORY75746.1 hypothetical protein BCR37DRAFT_170985 [Protomyces lactucae-debilis]